MPDVRSNSAHTISPFGARFEGNFHVVRPNTLHWSYIHDVIEVVMASSLIFLASITVDMRSISCMQYSCVRTEFFLGWFYSANFTHEKVFRVANITSNSISQSYD